MFTIKSSSEVDTPTEKLVNALQIYLSIFQYILVTQL